MTEWLDKPAGRHGFLTYSGEEFVFEDSTPVKFWGVNICGNRPYVSNDEASRWTRFIARHGINGVRFHKFTWEATDGMHSTEITPEKWSAFDFFCRELRNAGIYYGWSHIYGHRVLPADSSRLLSYAEVRDTRFPWSHLNGTTSAIVNFAEDLQALNIELTINMLNHTNSLTGTRYADDPALTFIELQNEDDIFWGAIEETLKQAPSYRKLLCIKFSRWLKKKYGNEEKLLLAWNGNGLDENESLAAENIYPHPNHAIFTREYERALNEKRPVPGHIADRAAFLYYEQKKFYDRFVEAIRSTGYRGIIIGSCWQAGSGITHFYNLHADYEVGPIDRHNYFGGGTGHALKPGTFSNSAMISTPGSGLLSTGFQMVSDRPFQISEWMSLIPTEWTAESAPLIAVYGMGLQGWDASYAFAMDHPSFTPTIQSGHGIYNVTSPTQLSLYPALSAMVFRGDVIQGSVIANRNVDMKDLEQGFLPFMEKTSQQYDVKQFKSSMPMESLAIGRVTLSFDRPETHRAGNLDDYWDRQAKKIKSNTGQLLWDYSGNGYCTINTQGTQGVIGFTDGRTIELANMSIRTTNPFAVILITSMEKDAGIADSRHLLITTMARARNTGMQYSEDKTTLIETGHAPMLLEPVEAFLSLRHYGTPTVYAVDHSGNRTNVTVPASEGNIHLLGKVYKTFYYEVEYKEIR